MANIKLGHEPSLKSKRFLITQSSLRLLAGSEINTLELADYLQSRGAYITVYTHFFSEPISAYFEGRNIKVITDDKQLDIGDYDYVWVHHQIVPPSFLIKLSQGSTATAVLPAFIFMHMSGLKTHFLEQPHIWGLEERIAAKILFVSDETRSNITEHSLDSSKLDEGFYRNPTPVAFAKVKHISGTNLKKVLVVSNHPAEEVVEAAILLRKKGIDVVMAGEGQKKYKLITPDYLNKFDAVISIGKTVQYCLVANIPVYIYDIWGGPGYLNEDNEESARWYNFSGRHFDKKSAASIVEEIMKNYLTVVDYQSTHHTRFVKEYSMDSIVPSLIKSVKSRRVDSLDNYYTQYLAGALTMLKYKFYHENLLVKREEAIGEVEDVLRQTRNQLSQSEQRNEELHKNLIELENSESFRIGEFITRPARHLKRYFGSSKD